MYDRVFYSLRCLRHWWKLLKLVISSGLQIAVASMGFHLYIIIFILVPRQLGSRAVLYVVSSLLAFCINLASVS